MCELPEFFFALFNCPETHQIRVKDGEVFATGDMNNLGAERLKMDLNTGHWVNHIGVRHSPLRLPTGSQI